MKVIPIAKVRYKIGMEKSLKKLLYNLKEPLIIEVDNFPSMFDLNYFKSIQTNQFAIYSEFENGCYIRDWRDRFSNVIDKIAYNESYRIFGQFMPEYVNKKVESYVPLWQTIDDRPKYFKSKLRLPFFIGGGDSFTELHYDREQVHLLHLCLYGKKRFYLFTEDQSRHLYKEPFIGNSKIIFQNNIEDTIKSYPNLKNAKGYIAELKCGEMLFMPKNCWHYTQYLGPSVATCYSFYPKKIDQILGCLTGYFYFGYKEYSGFSNIRLIELFRYHYSCSIGVKKIILKIIEKTSFLFLFLPIVLYYKIKVRLIKFRQWLLKLNG